VDVLDVNGLNETNIKKDIASYVINEKENELERIN
jgi:hypothetical protein